MHSALAVASRNGLMQMIRLLVTKGSKVWGGNSALMIACENERNYEVVQFLLDRGAKVDMQCSAGNTALIIASKNGNTEVVQLLLDGGAKT